MKLKVFLAGLALLWASLAHADNFAFDDAVGNRIIFPCTTVAGVCTPTVSATTASGQTVDLIKVGGAAIALGQTTMAASIPVAISSNQSALDVGQGTAGTADSSVVTVQGIASMTPLLANPGTAANWGIGATAAAPPANAIYSGANASGATGGLLAGLKTCDLHAKYDASDNGNITLVTGVSGRKVYVCGFLLANGATATNLSLTEGSDANCATNNAALTPVYQVLGNQSIGVMAPFWTGLATSTVAYYLCIKSSAGNAHQAEVWYTIQ